MSERVFLADQGGDPERFRVDERRVLCAGCGAPCRGSLCRECEAIERARPAWWPGEGDRRRETGDR